MPKRAGAATPRPVTDDTTTVGRSAYQQGVDANKARNQHVLDSLGTPQLTAAEGPPPKRCGPNHCVPGRPLSIHRR